jgi:hypothetical protein
MARFSDFLGRRVLVHFRAQASPVPSLGVLVGDTGRAVFLEETFAQDATVKRCRWEIPYHCIGSMQMDDDEPLVSARPAAD